VLPAIPVAMSRTLLGFATSALFMLALAVAISETRAQKIGRPRAYTTTMATLLVASTLSITAALLVGAA
jgi:hypothetical protein